MKIIMRIMQTKLLMIHLKRRGCFIHPSHHTDTSLTLKLVLINNCIFIYVVSTLPNYF